MSEHTATPWQFSDRNWRGEQDRCNFYITGDHGDGSCVGIAIVCGNATAGEIPKANAEYIVRAVNSHEQLLSACREMLRVVDDCYEATGHFKVANPSEQRRRLEAAIAKAEGRS